MSLYLYPTQFAHALACCAACTHATLQARMTPSNYRSSLLVSGLGSPAHVPPDAALALICATH